MDSAGPNTSATLIPAFSKRQVMDWSLVLASQDIPATIVQPDETGWGLAVEPQDYERAREAIRLYRAENRRWHWRQPIPWSEATFHWGALGWCLVLILIHWLTYYRFPAIRQSLEFASKDFAHGQWWRAFTAILLHADEAHLLANTTSGLLLFGLAMARFGAGPALLAGYLAGAAGNFLGYMLHPQPYTGLGASGMVMGALGLITISPFVGVGHPRGLKRFTQAVFSGVLLFMLLGVNPASDVIAHLGGFIAGFVFGAILALVPERVIQSSSFVGATWFLFLTLLTLCTCLALHSATALSTH